MAYGRRGIDKLADILRDPSQTDSEVCSGLYMLNNALSTQEKKLEALKADTVKVRRHPRDQSPPN